MLKFTKIFVSSVIIFMITACEDDYFPMPMGDGLVAVIPYKKNHDITHNGITYGIVKSPYTGKVWLDRNLGASQVCTAFNDAQCYGDYYQWGRNWDGHEDSSSAITRTQSENVTTVGHSDFIISNYANDYDWAKTVDATGATRQTNWSKTDGSSVCPIGFRVPTIVELRAETLDNEITDRDSAFISFLRLPSAGRRGRASGSMLDAGSWGYVWASSVDGSGSSSVLSYSVGAVWYYSTRAYGFSVRCLRD